ncbi:hypothetical protein, partial [Litorimonas sp.]|uniref:hypothetical protein n=1 Tax=Litorimonas sp. TaxID=1892381 RepID=UPI003A8557D6
MSKPDKFPRELAYQKIEHDPAASVSLYSTADLKSWAQELEFASYEESTPFRLTLGTCANDGEDRCFDKEEDILPYSFQGLIPFEHEANLLKAQ